MTASNPARVTPRSARLRRTSRAWSVAGVILVLLLWHVLARQLGPLLLATPWDALYAIGPLVQGEHFFANVGPTLLRIGTGVLGGVAAGFVLGLLAGLSTRVRGLLEPLRWMLMAVPPVVMVVLAMLWFGLGSPMVIVMTTLMIAPGMYVNTVKGMLHIDRQLIEMAQVYRLGPWLRLRHVYLPALGGPLMAALLIALCGGVRLVVMAEVLGAENGVGYALANARATFDTAELYAWVMLILAFVAFLEFALLQPLQRHLGRWMEPSHA